MKKILMITLFTVGLYGIASATIKGNGVLKNESREAGSFSDLASSGPMNVEISYGTSSSLEIEGDENILPYIETFVKNGTLKIKVKDLTNIKPSHTIRVKVNMTTINSISQSGSGTISGKGNFTSNNETKFSMSGSGKIKLGFDSFKQADISMSGSGQIDLKGTIDSYLFIKQSGSGTIDCEEAPCENATVKINGSGTIRLNTSSNLSANISGSGKIYYTGTPKIDSHISGSGRIQKI